MIRPAALKKGDKIGLAAPARKVSREEMEPAIHTLRSWGFEVVEPKNLYGDFHQFSGTDDQRLEDLRELIDHPEIKAILCVRGGYGSVRIINRVDLSPLRENPKWICGYSDITVFHNTLSGMEMESLHCVMPIDFGRVGPESLESLKTALLGKNLNYTAPAHPFNRPGRVTAPLTGGNLSMLYSQTGSPSAIGTQGKILFLEDLDEYLYHIDRMMQNLKRNGYFENPAAVIVGGMDRMNDNTIPFGFSAEEIIHHHLDEYDYPVCFGFPSGHGNENLALIFGREATLEVGTETKLNFYG